MPKAQEIGKFIYIEPNNLNTDKPSNAIPQPYEDYSMAVDLQVEIPSRDSCGDPSFKKILYFSSDNGTISFFGGSGGGDGKQGYLTTNYTDVSATNVGKGNKECLGINSINITYDSWFFPTVTINFVDVRGASLMMPQEYAYRTEVSNGSKDISQLSGGSFFKALFSFPYPLFKLTVKGFYGRAAVYNLAVRDFKANFNSNTGNFECVVQFIGYMFGVYTDIPMTYLAVAPYIGRTIDSKYGSSWTTSKFVYHAEDKNGKEMPTTQMMTYPEFKLAIKTANMQLDKIVASTQTALDINEVLKKRTALTQIKDAFIGLGLTKINSDQHIYYRLGKEKDADFAKRVIELKQRVDTYCDANYSENDSGSLKRTLKPLFDLIVNEGNDKYIISMWKSNVGGLEEPVTTKENTKSENVINSLGRKNFDYFKGKKSKQFDDDLRSYANTHKGIKSEICAVAFALCTDFVDYLEKQDKEYERKNRNFDIELNKEKLKILGDLLGFQPSIKNIFDMTFAHMETFIKEYYNVLNEIRDDMEHKRRNPGTFGISDEKQTDFRLFGPDNPSNSTKPSEKQVPPFPLFVEEVIENDGTKINRLVGPWEFSKANMNMPEMKLVIKLLNASKFYSEEAKKVNEELEKAREAQDSTLPSVDNLIPVTLYDFFNNDFNPYQCVQFIGNKDTDRTNQIILIFFLRWYYFTKTFKIDTNDNKYFKYFAQMEAFNLKRALSKITENIRKTLLEGDVSNLVTSGTDLWNIGGKKTLFKTNATNIEYNWIEKDGKQYLPVGEFNINTIKTDIARGVINTSNKYVVFSGGTFDPISNVSNFRIDSNGKYFEQLISEIKNADDGDGKVKDKFLKDLDEGSIFTTSKKKGEEAYINNGQVFTTGEKTAVNKNVYAAGSVSAGIAQTNTVLTSTKNQTYTVRDIINDNVPSDELDNLRVVGDGTYVNGDYNKSVFFDDLFNLQQSNLSKAYLFVMSLPLRTKIFDDGKHIINNGTVLKSILLREGAYWWRHDYNGEPVTILTQKYKLPLKTDWFITKKDSTFNYLPKDSTEKYLPFIDYISTNGRKEAIKRYFINWAETEFEKILYYVNKYPNVYKDDADYKRLIMETLSDFETVVDEAPLIVSNGKKDHTIELGRTKLPDFYYAFTKFKEILKGIYKAEDDLAVLETENNMADGTDIVNDKEIMLSTYMVLKSLYDKWFCGMDQTTWFLESENSDFKNFKYIDSYYNNIGHKLIPNIDNTLSLVDKYMPAGSINDIQDSTQYAILSVHQFLSENCEKIGVYFKSLPLMYGLDPTDKDKIEDMFDAIPFSKYTNGGGINDGQTYLCMYTYKPSEHLDIRDDAGQYDWTDDSFDIADISGNRSNTLPTPLYEVGKNTIPAFGVTYAAQNQSYFKSIGVSMDNPMQTEASIATTMMLASKSDESPREMTLYGQDLYRIYSNYSYTCNVEMMGNSQIVPMMYFQLNNIPMFRGAYMITKVEHSIRAGDMTTKFTGVRQNKNAMPLVIGAAILFDSTGSPNIDGGRTEGSTNYSTEGYANVSWKTPESVKNLDTLSTYTLEKPLICLTPAHGPNTQKSREWAWSSQLIDKYIIPTLKSLGYGQQIRRCNIDGANTSSGGYSGSEVRAMIKKHGSNNVISYVPHWNGGGGTYFAAFKNKKGLYTRPGSDEFCKICVKQADIIKKSVERGSYGNTLPEGMMDGASNVYNLFDKNTDWASSLDCDCVLTENWFADYAPKGETGWQGAKWLESVEGFQVISDMAVQSIVSFIRERTKHPEWYQ